MKKSERIALVIIAVSFILGVYLYPSLPDSIASHWNDRGEVDGYLGKFWGIFLLPIISVGALLLFMIFSRIDPKRENIEKFRKHFDKIIIFIFLFFFYIHVLSLLWNLGYKFEFIKLFIPGFAVLFFFVGEGVENAEQNWTMGIRTPWTLSSESVWKKTHKISGMLFKISSAIMLLGLLVSGYEFWFVIIPILFSAFFGVVYSFVIFRSEKTQL